MLQRIPVRFQRNIEHGFLQELFAYPMEGRKEMFYLTTHSTHFILRLYDVIHMVKDHLDFEGGNPLPPHGLLFPISSKIILYASSRRQDNTYYGLCYTSRGALAGTRNSSLTQWVPDVHVARYKLLYGAFIIKQPFLPLIVSPKATTSRKVQVLLWVGFCGGFHHRCQLWLLCWPVGPQSNFFAEMFRNSVEIYRCALRV